MTQASAIPPPAIDPMGALVQALGAGVAVVDGAGRLRFVNARFREITMRDEAQLLSGELSALVNAQDQGALGSAFTSLAGGLEAAPIEIRLQRPGADDAWVRITLTRLPSPDAGEGAVAALVTDVSGEHATAFALRENEARLRALMEAMPAMVIVADGGGRAVFTNRAWEDFSGLVAEEGPRWAVRGYIHPDDLPAAAVAWQRALATGEGYDIDYRVRRGNGEYCWVAFKICPVLGAAGEVIAWTSAAIDIDERVRDRESLVESEARLKALIDATPAMVVMTDPRGVTQLVSQQWTAFTGLDAQHTQDWEQLRTIHPEDDAATAEERRAGLESRKGYSVDYRLRRADKQFRWVNATVRPAITPDGRVLGWMFVGLDVHERVLARQRLEQLNADLRLLAESIPAIVITAPEDAGIPPFANRRWTEFTGIPLEEVTPDTVARLIHREDGDRVLAASEAARESRTPYDIEFRLRRADGAYRWLNWRAQPLADSGNRPLGWIVVAMDIDDQVRNREELQAWNEQLRILSDAGQAIAEAPDYGSAVNAAAARVVPSFADWCALDLLEGEAIIRKVAVHSEAIDADHGRVLAEAPPLLSQPNDIVTGVILNGESVFFRRMPADLLLFRRTDEQLEVIQAIRPNSSISVPLQSPGGRTYGALSVARVGARPNFTEQDCSTMEELGRRLGAVLDRARLFAELGQALAAKDEFFGFVSHELRTPLTTVMGVSDVLSKRYADLDETDRREALALIHRDSRRLDEIIANMLTLARSERETGDEPVLVQHIIASTVAVHLQRHPDRAIEVHAPGGLPPVLSPAGWLDRVLENLITNAEKYSPAGLPIEVEAALRRGKVEVRVLDRGRGITPAQMAEVFEPFFRANPNEPGVPGVGLGLTVCRRLVERLGGELWLTPREGGGTEAGFRLPTMSIPDD